MTGRGRDCYSSKDDLVKSYWGAGYAIPGDKKLDPPTVRDSEGVSNGHVLLVSTHDLPAPPSH